MNVVFICLEDCNAQALGCYGNDVVKTPHIDALARSGVRFDRAYCQFPACNPSRASFLTGLRPNSTRVISNQMWLQAMLPKGVKTLPEMLPDDAYSVSVGKLFHRSPPQLRAFDRVAVWLPFDPAVKPKGAKSAADQKVPIESREKTRSGDPKPLERERYRLHTDRFGASSAPERSLKDNVIGEAARAFVRGLGEHGRRFFLSVGSSLPHTPLLCPQRCLDAYSLDEIPLPDGWDTERDRSADLFIDRQPTEQQAREAIRAYYASVSFVDEQVGKILQELEDSGQADRTIVVLFADHGFHLGDQGHWGKYTLLDPSTRVPLIVRVPGSSAGGMVCDEIVELVDLVPTLADLMGFAPPARLEGTSFAPLLDHPEQPWKTAAFTRSRRGLFRGDSVRTKRYRYTEWRRKDGETHRELFDMDSPAGETVNPAAVPEYEENAAELAALLRAGWRAALPGAHE